MKGLHILLDHSYKYLKEWDYDNLIIIDGPEGKGKSNLALHGLDYWYTKLYGKVTAEDVKHINLSPKGFVTDLKDLKRYEATVYDEAGDLSNLRQMDKFNYRITLSYQVMRGLNLLTFLVMPSIFRLNPYFVKDRAKFLLHVYKRDRNRAYYKLYTRDKIRVILYINQYRVTKKVNVVNPVFHDNFRVYDGVLSKPYLEKKEARLNSVREELYNTVVEEEKADLELEAMYRANKMLGATKTGLIWNVTRKTIYNRLKKLKTPPSMGKLV